MVLKALVRKVCSLNSFSTKQFNLNDHKNGKDKSYQNKNVEFFSGCVKEKHIIHLGFEAHFYTSQMTNAMNLSVCIFADAHNTTDIE